MKQIKLFSALLILTQLITSCVTQGTLVPLKSSNVVENSFIIPTSKDKVWERVIDFFADNSISIGVMEKESGLITSKETSFPITVEMTNGQFSDPSAFVLVQRMSDFKEDGTGIRAMSNWNIRVKETEKGTELKINIGKINAEAYIVATRNGYGMPLSYEWRTFSGQAISTGNFEKMIYEYVTKN